MIGKAHQIAAIALLVMATGCSKKPAGQVIATVDGTEITQRDLIAELQAVGGKSAQDMKTLQPQLIESIVNRKLLVAEAKRQNLDKDPKYLLINQRLQEVLLTRMLADSWKQTPKPASDDEARAFIAANPQMFAQHKIMLADELRTTVKDIDSAQLAALHSNDEIATWLKARKKTFQRSRRTIDTAQLSGNLATDLGTRVGGEPLAVRNGDQFSILAIVAVRDTPVPAADELRLAKAALAGRAALADAESHVKALRQASDIKYLSGYAPASEQQPH